jgi:hypothetical protein
MLRSPKLILPSVTPVKHVNTLYGGLLTGLRLEARILLFPPINAIIRSPEKTKNPEMTCAVRTLSAQKSLARTTFQNKSPIERKYKQVQNTKAMIAGTFILPFDN